MIRLLPVPLLVLLVLAVFASPADAKSPFFKAELSGGDITTPIMINDVIPGAWIDSYDMDAPVSQPSQVYTLRLFNSDENGNVGAAWATFTYYPSHDGQNAAIRHTDGTYGTVLLSLSQLIEKNLPSQEATLIGGYEDGGTSVAWWAIPSAVGLGLFVVGGGVAGRRMLKRRQAAAA